MGLRFHKSIKLGKFLKLNINKKTISLTTGVKGAHFTVNNKGKKTATVSLPGTGLSYTKTFGKVKNEETKSSLFENVTNELEDTVRDIKDDIIK